MMPTGAMPGGDGSGPSEPMAVLTGGLAGGLLAGDRVGGSSPGASPRGSPRANPMSLTASQFDMSLLGEVGLEAPGTGSLTGISTLGAYIPSYSVCVCMGLQLRATHPVGVLMCLCVLLCCACVRAYVCPRVAPRLLCAEHWRCRCLNTESNAGHVHTGQAGQHSAQKRGVEAETAAVSSHDCGTA